MLLLLEQLGVQAPPDFYAQWAVLHLSGVHRGYYHAYCGTATIACCRLQYQAGCCAIVPRVQSPTEQHGCGDEAASEMCS